MSKFHAKIAPLRWLDFRIFKSLHAKLFSTRSTCCAFIFLFRQRRTFHWLCLWNAPLCARCIRGAYTQREASHFTDLPHLCKAPSDRSLSPLIAINTVWYGVVSLQLKSRHPKNLIFHVLQEKKITIKRIEKKNTVMP